MGGWQPSITIQDKGNEVTSALWSLLQFVGFSVKGWILLIL